MAQEHKESSEDKLAKANMHRIRAVQEGYFDKLAQYGYVPETPEQAENWLKLASFAEARRVAENRDNGTVLDKLAHALSEESGQSPEAAQTQEELLYEAFEKSAAFVDNQEMAADLLEAQLIERQAANGQSS